MKKAAAKICAAADGQFPANLKAEDAVLMRLLKQKRLKRRMEYA
jgi:hypothetical protein